MENKANPMIALTPENIDRYSKNCVLLDIETTGLSCERDSIIELCALKVIEGNIDAEFSTLINPGIDIPYDSTLIHGITDDMVAGAPDVEEALKAFKKFAGDAVLAGHNIKRFDLGFIQRDAARFLGRALPNEYMDTLMVARRFLPQLESRSLESLSRYYGISYKGAHRALTDCKINLEVFERLAQEAMNPSAEARALKVCPKCGNVMKQREGKFGPFYGCTSFPDCRYTEDIKN